MATAPNNSQNEEYSTCANPRCNCPVNTGDKYCCEYCGRKTAKHAYAAMQNARVNKWRLRRKISDIRDSVRLSLTPFYCTTGQHPTPFYHSPLMHHWVQGNDKGLAW
jgi:hypothetical protein